MKAKKLLMKPNARGLALAAGLVVVLALALAAGVQPAAAAPSSAQAVDPVSVVDAFHAAGDDIDAALALLTDDVVIELIPPPPNTTGKWTGKNEARAFFEWRNTQNIRRIRAGDAQVSTDAAGTIVTGDVGVTSDTFRKWRVGTVGHTFRAVVQDGKLKSYLGQIRPDEAKRVTAARLAFEQSQAQPAQPIGMPKTGEPLIILPSIFAVGVMMLMAGAVLRTRKV